MIKTTLAPWKNYGIAGIAKWEGDNWTQLTPASANALEQQVRDLQERENRIRAERDKLVKMVNEASVILSQGISLFGRAVGS